VTLSNGSKPPETPSNGFKPPEVDVRRLENLEPNAVAKPSGERANPPVFFTRKPLSPSLINDGIGFGEEIVDWFLVLTKAADDTWSVVPLDPMPTFVMTTSGKVTLPEPAPENEEKA
jgi:hypothetical protein